MKITDQNCILYGPVKKCLLQLAEMCSVHHQTFDLKKEKWPVPEKSTQTFDLVPHGQTFEYNRSQLVENLFRYAIHEYRHAQMQRSLWPRIVVGEREFYRFLHTFDRIEIKSHLHRCLALAFQSGKIMNLEDNITDGILERMDNYVSENAEWFKDDGFTGNEHNIIIRLKANLKKGIIDNIFR